MAMFAFAAALLGATTLAQKDAQCPSIITCPSANDTIVAAGDDFFKVECNANRAYGDMDLSGLPLQGSLEDCINECQSTDDCIAIAWNPGPKNCYIKSTVGALETPRPDVWGAVIIQGPRLTEPTAAKFTPCPTGTSAVPSSSSSLAPSVGLPASEGTTLRSTPLAIVISKSNVNSKSVNQVGTTSKPSSALPALTTSSSLTLVTSGDGSSTKRTIAQGYSTTSPAAKQPSTLTYSSSSKYSTFPLSGDSSIPIYGGSNSDTSCSTDSVKYGASLTTGTFSGYKYYSGHSDYNSYKSQSNKFRFARSMKVQSSSSVHASITLITSQNQSSTTTNAPMTIIPVIGSIPAVSSSKKITTTTKKISSGKGVVASQSKKSSSVHHSSSKGRNASSSSKKATSTSHHLSSTTQKPTSTDLKPVSSKRKSFSATARTLNTAITTLTFSSASSLKLLSSMSAASTGKALPVDASIKVSNTSLIVTLKSSSVGTALSSSSTFMLSTLSAQPSYVLTTTSILPATKPVTTVPSSSPHTPSSSILSGTLQPVSPGFGSSYISALSAQQSSISAKLGSVSNSPNAPSLTNRTTIAASSSSSTTSAPGVQTGIPQPPPPGSGSSYVSALSAQQSSAAARSMNVPDSAAAAASNSGPSVVITALLRPSYSNGTTHANTTSTLLTSSSPASTSPSSAQVYNISYPSQQTVVKVDADFITTLNSISDPVQTRVAHAEALPDLDFEDDGSEQDDVGDDGSNEDNSSDDDDPSETESNEGDSSAEESDNDDDDSSDDLTDADSSESEGVSPYIVDSHLSSSLPSISMSTNVSTYPILLASTTSEVPSASILHADNGSATPTLLAGSPTVPISETAEDNASVRVSPQSMMPSVDLATILMTSAPSVTPHYSIESAPAQTAISMAQSPSISDTLSSFIYLSGSDLSAPAGSSSASAVTLDPQQVSQSINLSDVSNAAATPSDSLSSMKTPSPLPSSFNETSIALDAQDDSGSGDSDDSYTEDDSDVGEESDGEDDEDGDSSTYNSDGDGDNDSDNDSNSDSDDNADDSDPDSGVVIGTDQTTSGTDSQPETL